MSPRFCAERTSYSDPFRRAIWGSVYVNFFDIFEIIGELGTGGFGTTYLIQKIGTRERYALKLFHESNLSVAASEVGQEVSVLMKLSRAPECKEHMPCYWGDFMIPRKNGRMSVAILSDYVEGPTLQQIIEEWYDPKARILFDKLLTAVIALHGMGYAHRDIKPSNAILSKEGCIVLIDFGLSCSFVHTDASVACRPLLAGTPLYMAPELIHPGEFTRGDSVNSYLSVDMYAVGITALELFTGPFEYSSQLVTGPFGYDWGPSIVKKLNSIPSTCIALLISRLLSYDPKDRPSASEARLELRSCMPR